MKTILLTIVSLFCCMQSHGAAGAHPVSCVFRSAQPDKPVDMEKLHAQMERYRVGRVTGIGLMSGGAAAVVVGEVLTILSAVHAEDNSYRYRSSSQDPLWIAGFSTLMAGVGGLGSGVPLYVIYNKRYKVVKHRIKKLSEGKSGITIE